MKFKIIQPSVSDLQEKKKFLLEQSKTFCMYPWISLHINPSGKVYPCCISSVNCDFGSTETQNLVESVNHPNMKQLRVDLLNDIRHDNCVSCYNHEETGIQSARQDINKRFGHYFDTDVTPTSTDGHLNTFQMRYYDIRFGNLCNFKCRTCGPAFSSQWETEMLKHSLIGIQYPKTSSNILPEVLSHVPNMMEAYFAGGEPLISEEHYIILEDMIRQNRTDIKLRYNSNISNLKYKDKDLLDLWKHFKQPVSVYASVDHVGERAEYMRHGTDWGVIETNIQKLRNSTNVELSMNTVFSVFNALTITDFYAYIYSKGWLNNAYQLYAMSSPAQLASTVLPGAKKQIAAEKLSQYTDYLQKRLPYHTFDTTASTGILYWMRSAEKWIFTRDDWELRKEDFRNTIQTIDNIRGESFTKVFPELADLMED